MISHEYLEPAPYKNVRIPVVVMVLVLGMSRTLNSLNFFYKRSLERLSRFAVVRVSFSST